MKQMIIRDTVSDIILEAEPVRFDWCALEFYIHPKLGFGDPHYSLTEPYTGTELASSHDGKDELEILFAEKVLCKPDGIDAAMKRGIASIIEQRGIANDWAIDPRDLDKIFDLEKLREVMEVSK